MVIPMYKNRAGMTSRGEISDMNAVGIITRRDAANNTLRMLHDVRRTLTVRGVCSLMYVVR